MLIRLKVNRQENTDYFKCLAGDIVSVDLEDYVACVVASEISNAHIEACKAQAVAARTFAMNFIGEGKHITDQSSSHQAFRASRWDAAKYPNANAAAAETAGMVLTYDGQILKTCSYSSSNGGRTVSAQERWGGVRPYLIAQDDPWDAAACRERSEKGWDILKGHGVGMSQYGAAWAAKNGCGYQEILAFYYVGAVIAPKYGRSEEMPQEKPDNTSVPLSNGHFMDFLHAMIGRPYWYGTCVYKCSGSLLSNKAKRYPSHYTSARMTAYKADIEAQEVCADCIGAAKGYAWTNGGEGVMDAIGTDAKITSKYGANGCPDKGANSMFAYAKDKGMPWGVISTIPEVRGLAVTFSGHVGYYDGNGKVIEFKGFSSGCVESRLSDGKWTHWYCLPFIQYGESVEGVAPAAVPLGARLLQKGSKGSDVAHLQRILAGMDYDLGHYGDNRDGVDGHYGDKTVKAVKRFQTFAQITSDGKYGSVTHKALMGVLDEMEKAEQEQDTAPDIAAGMVFITHDADVRSGPGDAYKIITRVDRGDELPFVATAAAVNWHAVELGGKIGWVSGDCAAVTPEGS